MRLTELLDRISFVSGTPGNHFKLLRHSMDRQVYVFTTFNIDAAAHDPDHEWMHITEKTYVVVINGEVTRAAKIMAFLHYKWNFATNCEEPFDEGALNFTTYHELA